MHFIYLDEAGNTGNNLKDAFQPIFVLGALIVPEAKWLKLEAELAAAIDLSFPPPRPDDFEVHGTELINARGYTVRRLEEQQAGLPVKSLDQTLIPWIKPLIHRGKEPLPDVLAWLESRQKKERPGS